MWLLEYWKLRARVVFLACVDVPLDSLDLELQTPSAPGSPVCIRRTSLDRIFLWIVLLTLSLSLHMLRIYLFVFSLEFFLLAFQGIFIVRNEPGYVTPCFCTGGKLCLSPNKYPLALSPLLGVSSAPPTGPCSHPHTLWISSTAVVFGFSLGMAFFSPPSSPSPAFTFCFVLLLSNWLCLYFLGDLLFSDNQLKDELLW